MLQAQVKAQVLVPLLQITLYVQQCGQGVLLVLPVTLLTWQLPALPTHSQHIHHPLETYLPHTQPLTTTFCNAVPHINTSLPEGRQADGNHSLPLPPLYQLKGPETCWTPSLWEDLEFRDMHSNLPLHDGFKQARFPE